MTHTGLSKYRISRNIVMLSVSGIIVASLLFFYFSPRKELLPTFRFSDYASFSEKIDGLVTEFPIGTQRAQIQARLDQSDADPKHKFYKEDIDWYGYTPRSYGPGLQVYFVYDEAGVLKRIETLDGRILSPASSEKGRAGFGRYQMRWAKSVADEIRFVISK